jgi:7,8-dihydropterin-6-yl-methyl-4-(beta-D-ribofuranosyl)aminobenzene 5'-phosphate synthase
MAKLTIRVIYDNCQAVAGFQEGWGFSCLVDVGRRRILFDTGADPKAFFSNLQNFNIPCEEITDVVFSHKHSDHTAGFHEVLAKLKEGSRLFLPKRFLSFTKPPSHLQVVVVDDFKEIDSGVYSLVLKGGLFLYEQALLLQTEKGLVMITGCAHPGIVQLLEAAQKQLTAPVHLVLGGFHLFRKSDHQISQIVEKFKSLRVETIAPCHCTGEVALEQFKTAFQDRFYKVGAGTTLALD